MKFGEREVRQSCELELHGVLQKKNRNGIYQNRYFRTQGPYLQYWTSSQEHAAQAEPSSSYDMREIRVVEATGDRHLYIQFMNDKFKLDLRAISDEQCAEWADFIKAKQLLHSANKLLSSDLGNDFKTQTFSALLKLPVAEQDRWINDFLNDAFECVYDDESRNPDSTGNPRAVLAACKTCLDEFSLTCDECALEMTSRAPQIVAQCRDYMHRYSDHFRSRLTLELSPFLGLSHGVNSVENLSDEVIVEAIRLFQTLDTLRKHKFLPRNFFNSFRENLCGAEQLMKTLLDILVKRNDTWYAELNELQPRQRGHKLAEYYKIVNFQIQKIHDTFYVADSYDVKTKQSLLLLVVDTLAITLARHVDKTSFADYGEEALLSHILACQECVKYFSTLRIYPQAQAEGEEVDEGKKKWVMALSRSCIEQIGTIFLRSANQAATAAVQNMSQTLGDIMSLFLVESGSWLGGKVCRVYLDRVTSWMDGFCHRAASKPCEFHRIIRRETIRLVVVMYIRNTIDKYRLNKRFKLSERGETQVASDLQVIGRWVQEQNERLIPPYIEDRGSYTGSNDITMLIRNLRLFITADDSNLMLCFVESIQHFGMPSAPHLYDLARLAMKIRSDLPKKVRLTTLASFGCYIEQLNASTAEPFGPLSHPHPRLSGPDILQELCPLAGIQHCTGKKWSYEKLQDTDGSITLEIANLVTDACNVARLRRAGYVDTAGSEHLPQLQSSSSVTSLASGNASESSPDKFGSWQLLDPDHLKLSSHPPEMSRRLSATDALSGFTHRERLNSVDLDTAIANISVLDNVDSEKNSTGDYNFDSNRPFVDLYGLSFEELHASLRPPMYTDSTFRKPILVVPERRGSARLDLSMIPRSVTPLSQPKNSPGLSKVFGRYDPSHEGGDCDGGCSDSSDEFAEYDGVFVRNSSVFARANSIEEKTPSQTGDSIIGDTESYASDTIGSDYEPLPADSHASREQLIHGEISDDNPISSSSTIDICTENTVEPVSSEVEKIVPPAKPPKPRRYSLGGNTEQSEVVATAARNSPTGESDNGAIVDKLRIAQKQLSDKCRQRSMSTSECL